MESQENSVTLSINSQLKGIVQELSIDDLFENQRRNIGKAYRLANDIREASKDGIASLKSGLSGNVLACQIDMKRHWEELIHLNLPDDISWQHQSEAGQEMVEFVFVDLFYPLLTSDVKEVPIIPTYQDLLVSPQIWLAGIADSTTELSKLARHLLLNSKLTKEERKNLRKRFLKVAEEAYDFLERFETVYGQVINNSRRRFYGNTFRGMLGRVERVIEIHQDALIESNDQEAK